ncbi:MAG: cold-shock protein, partial [Pseudonocardiales bacterium]
GGGGEEGGTREGARQTGCGGQASRSGQEGDPGEACAGHEGAGQEG